MGRVAHETALSVAAAIRGRKVSPVEVLDECLRRVDAADGRLNAVVWRDDEQARAAARRATDVVMQRDGDDLAPFHGVPIPIKDLTEVEGWPVTYGSWGTPDAPSLESAPVVRAFERGGFVLAGRTSTPAFGLITATESARFGVTRNPWDLDRTPGGSSGGAGAAVAAGLFPIAHATDGGGSIRIPASCCGLVGLKASRGRIPSLVTAWEGAAVAGVVTHDVADTAGVLDLLSRPDPACWYNAPRAERPFADEVGAPPGRLRIGVATRAPLGVAIDPACGDAARAAASVLESLGHHVVEAELEVPEETVAAFLAVVGSGLADYDHVDWERTEPHVQAARRAAAQVDSLTYVRAVHALQRDTRSLVARWGADWDVLVMPTMAIQPPEAGVVLAMARDQPDRSDSLVLQMSVMTWRFNISGQPAISLPLHESPSGLPVGVQLVGGPWEEARLLRLAAQLEVAMPWAQRRPALFA
jgi:amidase